MTLEDFFTLTEMKDGLTAPARVQELIFVMKEKDEMVKNVGDTTRQWVAVASSITATENKECLDLFIKLDGLFFINKWLKDAQKFANEESACFVEEAISALLQAVEKLKIEDEQLVSSGICITVKDLLSYKSPKVQDKARALFDRWKPKNSDVISMDVVDAKKNSEHSESRVTVNDGSLAITPVDQKSIVSDGEIVTLTNGQESSHLTSGHVDMKNECPDTVVSPVKFDSFVNDLSVKKEVLCSSGENLDPLKQGTSDVVSEKCELVSEEARDDDKVANLPDKVDKIVASSCWGVSDERKNLSGTYDTAVQEAVAHPDGSTYDTCERMLVETNDTNGLVVTTNEPRFEDVGNDNSTILEQGNGSTSREIKEQETTESTLKEVDKDDEVKRQLKNKTKRSGKSNKFARLAKNSKNTDLIRQTANIEDGTFDALEVACLVANEVEREVGNYNEQSGTSSSYLSSPSSSSERNSTGITQPDSPKSITGEQDPEINGPLIESQTMENVSLEPSKKETNQENHLQDMESSQLTDAIRDPESNKEKHFAEFDLNQEFSSEDLDQTQVDANPASIVSAPRAVVGPGLVAGPLKFEGNLGWKGSAATSAFRPASPRHASDSDRALSGGGPTSSGSRQKQDFLDFDLNVASGDDKVVNNLSRGKERETPPVFLSGESSFESSSKQPKTLMFDLNQTEEDGNGNGNGNASASQSSGGRLFGFDLNANHSNGNDTSLTQSFPWGPSSSSKVNSDTGHQDESVISILGTKVKKNAFPPQTSLPFQNGRASEPYMDNSNLLRGGPLMGFGPPVPYQQPPVYGYNGIAMGPSMGPPMSFSSAPIYGPTGTVPYMFDTRGVPFAPQMFGATSAVPSSYGQPSLAMNMMGATFAPNVESPLRPCADLNSGHTVDFGNRDPAFLRQLFLPGQNRQLDDQLRDSFRPSSSGGSSGKRKEPESGWELFPTNYKHHQPPHL